MEFNDMIFDTSRLTFEGEFEDQVQELLTFVRLTRDEVEGLQLLFDDLQETLESAWQGCRVMAFGSIVTGLGIKSSDVDCYVELPPWLFPPQQEFVKQARTILKKRPRIFQNLFAIVGARVPIIKFYHAPTGRNCDVSFSSLAGVANSKLLSYLLQIDKRILPLAIIIKYWSKVHNLTGTNLMPNYCLTLLVIFYLQQRAVLPAVHCLQRGVHELVSNWNMGFVAPLHVNSNRESLYQLLTGFFRYYNGFDFDKYVISPYLGYPVERNVFSSVESVPDDFVLYKENISRKVCKPLRIDSLLCVQDPFDHSRNCSVAIYPKLWKTILMNFDRAARSTDDRGYLTHILTKLDNGVPKPIKQTRPVARGIVKNKNFNQRHKQLKQNIKHNHYRNRRQWM